jgi:predicted acetyltransferase
MVNETIWYEYNNFTNFQNIHINSNNLSISKIQLHNFSDFTDKIQLSIDKFNSQIEWDTMWDLNEAYERLSRNNILYLLLKNDLPIGHVWYIGEYLYNAFVSNERVDGESQWFIQQTMLDRNKSGYDTITLYTEKWNTRANSFWKKLGYTIIDKFKLREYGTKHIPQIQGND